MSGRITAISGPTVTVDLQDLRLYDRVAVGRAGLLGEAIRLGPEGAVVQVYQETRGLAVGEPARGVGKPLTARLVPGLLCRMFDGLQRDLEQLRQDDGPFLRHGLAASEDSSSRRWRLIPRKQAGDAIAAGEAAGYVEEGTLRHPVGIAPAGGVIARIADGEIAIDGTVAELTDGRTLRAGTEWPVRQPRLFRRKLPCGEPLITGQRCLDFLLPLARGGTAILPGGFGTGKTILEQTVAKYAAADVVVYVGCGERGNEMAEMLGEFATLADPWSKRPLMERTIVVVNTSNMPVAAREASIYTAATLAEYYRDLGCNVLLLADSLSRWAEALREISSALEEMPGEEGYPTYLASRLAGFLARAGVVETLDGRIGSVSMILSVSPPGGDFTEPVTQACLRAAGALYLLDTGLAHRRHFPALHWSRSYSLYATDLGAYFAREVDPQWGEWQRQCRDLLQREEELRQVAEVVGSEGLQEGDRLLMRTAERIRREFLCQNAYTDDAFSTPLQTAALIRQILADHRDAEGLLQSARPPQEE